MLAGKDQALTGLRKLFRPPKVFAILGELFLAPFVVGQFVCVVPHENMQRDTIIFNLVTGGGALVFFTLALTSWIRKRKRDRLKVSATGQQ